MKILTCTVLFFVIQILSNAQETIKNCNCPKGTFNDGGKPDTSFYFNNGKTIVLCGYVDTELIKNRTVYSEFSISICDQDTVINSWGAVNSYEVRKSKDTLLIEELIILPTGKHFEYRPTIWTIERFYFKKDKLIRRFGINRNIRKYNEQEIQIVLHEYETSKKGLDEKKMELSDKLFISAISGNKTAHKYFLEFENKFGTLDGHFQEEYGYLKDMLKLWNENK